MKKKPHLMLVRSLKDEPVEVFDDSQAVAMSIASDECSDDRPSPVPQTHGSNSHPGLALRARREARGLSLEDIARTTKISKNILRALEDSDVLHLPAAIYTRGFVKAYAHEVGLNPERAADEYLRLIEPRRTEHLLVDDGLLPPLADDPARYDANDDARNLLAENQVRRFSRLAFAIAAIGLAGYLLSFSRMNETSREATGDVTEDAVPAGGVSDDAPPDAAQASLTSSPLKLEFLPRGPCWVSIHVDGEPVLAKLLQAGDHETIEVSDEAVVRVGEPGALSYSINGQSGRTLGPAGQPVTIRITKDNFRDFLSS